MSHLSSESPELPPSPSPLQTPTGGLVVNQVVPNESESSPSSIILSLIIPTYNEVENIASLVTRLNQLLSEALGEAFEIIVVDDNSPDETWRVALETSTQVPCVKVIRRIDERGLSTAVIRGWQAARGEVLGVIDADLQHPPEVCLELVREITRGADLAVASRNVAGGGISDWSLARRILSRGAQMLGLLILPGVFGRLSDPMSGYFMIRRTAIQGIELDPLGYKILIEVVARGRAQWIAEAPYIFRERNEGASKVTWKLYVAYLRHLGRLRIATLGASPFFRYGLVGALGLALETALLYWLSDSNQLGLGILRSKLIAAQPILFLSFMLHETWTFSAVKRPAGMTHVMRRLMAHVAVAWVGLGFALAILTLLVHFFHLDQYSANGVAVLMVGGWNYWLHRKVTWVEVSAPLS